MLIDSYETPGGREPAARRSRAPFRGRRSPSPAGHRGGCGGDIRGRRWVVGVACVLPALVLVAARSAVCVVTYVIARRVQYPVGSAWSAPTQLVFVPMLFVLPTPIVPLVVAGCSVLERLPPVISGHLGPSRLLAAVGDSFYALGPALVLVLFGAQVFAWDNWPVFVLAFAAQVAFDLGAGLGPHLVRRAHPPVRAAADGVAVRHRSVPLLRGAGDRGVRVGAARAGAPGAAAGGPDGPAGPGAPAAPRVLTRPDQRVPPHDDAACAIPELDPGAPDAVR